MGNFVRMLAAPLFMSELTRMWFLIFRARSEYSLLVNMLLCQLLRKGLIEDTGEF